MEMDMQEPGEMYCCDGEEQNLVFARRKPEKITGPHAPANHIIISCLSIDHFS